MKKVLTFILLMLLSTTSIAENKKSETWVHAGMWSHHYRLDNKNEVHDLLGLEYRKWLVTGYNNSEYKKVYVLGKYFENCNLEYNHFNLCMGTMIGIGHIRDGEVITPYIVPNIKLNYKKIGTEIDVLPEVIAIRFKIRID